MKPFNTRVIRTTASLTLLAWMFAFVSGVANACLLEREDAGSRGASPESSHSAHGHGESAHHVKSAADPAHDVDISKEPCLKVCDDGSHSLPSQNAGLDLNDPGAAVLIAVLWAPSANNVAMPDRLREWRRPPPGQPVRMRYSRLTL
jgi:hypothetical protein